MAAYMWIFLIFTNFFRLLFSLQSFYFHIFTKKQFVILSSLQCVCYSLARDKLHTIRWHTKTRISVCSIQCNNVRLLRSWFCAKTRTMIYSFVKLIGILIVIFNKDIWTHRAHTMCNFIKPPFLPHFSNFRTAFVSTFIGTIWMYIILIFLTNDFVYQFNQIEKHNEVIT